MKLDYAAKISPFPLYLPNIGNIKPPVLRDIWSPEVTYKKYQIYISLLLAVPDNGQDAEQEDRNMFDIISEDRNLQEIYCEMFNFFFTENVSWMDSRKVFATYKLQEEKTVPVGVIHRNVYEELCNIILQLCGIENKDICNDMSKAANRRSREIMKKLNAGRKSMSKSSKADSDLELPNLISAIAVKSNSLNFINIWDLTVCQLYEQFKREQTGVFFDIQKMSVAAYGNEKKLFRGNEWFKNN